MNVLGKRIFVGLSGGVDSAVSATLLKKAGANVVGVFIKGWYPPNMPCPWAEDRRDAMRVAAFLHIPFQTFDASIEYKRSVIDYLLSEYKTGRTPNPDIMCNRDVKFGAFFNMAIQQGADAIATGHYAQVSDSVCGGLMRGVDESKDQSYFLWAVPKKVLEHTFFPVGAMPKREVRLLAERFGLPVAKKRDSQGVCFLGDISIEDFLKSEVGEASGEAYTITGEKVGEHEGVLLYTIGERIRLYGAGQGPWYVLKKDVENNTLVVTNDRSVDIVNTKRIQFKNANWFLDQALTKEAQLRYHGEKISGYISGDTFIPQTSMKEIPTSGQSIVFYSGENVVGGGIITTS